MVILGGSLVGVWNGWGYGIAIFRALNFQISEPEIWQKSLFLRNFRDFPGKFGLWKNIFRTLEKDHSIRHQSIPPLSAGRNLLRHSIFNTARPFGIGTWQEFFVVVSDVIAQEPPKIACTRIVSGCVLLFSSIGAGNKGEELDVSLYSQTFRAPPGDIPAEISGYKTPIPSEDIRTQKFGFMLKPRQQETWKDSTQFSPPGTLFLYRGQKSHDSKRFVMLGTSQTPRTPKNSM